MGTDPLYRCLGESPGGPFVVDCGRGRDILSTSRRYRHRYRIRRCERVTVAPSPGQGGTPAG